MKPLFPSLPFVQKTRQLGNSGRAVEFGTVPAAQKLATPLGGLLVGLEEVAESAEIARSALNRAKFAQRINISPEIFILEQKDLWRIEI